MKMLPQFMTPMRIFLVTTFLLLTFLVHILWTTRPGQEHHAALQLGRIDFTETLTPGQAIKAVSAIRAIPGVTIAKLNTDSTALIYSFATGTHQVKDVAHQFTSQIDFPAMPHIPSGLDKANGCPVTGNRGILARISLYFRNLI